MGADYRFTHFDYTRGFGNTQIHSVGLNYSTQFTRHLQLSARIGGARVESQSLAASCARPGRGGSAGRVGGHTGRLSAQLTCRTLKCG